MWKYYALLSAFCASLTALFSKLGVRDINSDLATAIRVSFILVLVWGIALASGAVRRNSRYRSAYADISSDLRRRHRPVLAVLFQGIAGGRCFQGRSRRQAQRSSHHSAFHSAAGRARQCEDAAGRRPDYGGFACSPAVVRMAVNLMPARGTAEFAPSGAQGGLTEGAESLVLHCGIFMARE